MSLLILHRQRFALLVRENHYDGQEWTTYTTEDGLLDDWVNGISIGPDGNIWVATEKGISCFDGNTWQALVPLADGFEVKGLLVDDQNNLWFTVDQRGFLPTNLDSTGIRVYDESRMALPVGAIKVWRITRIALIAAIISLLFVSGQRKSHIPAEDRFQTSLKFSLITSGIIFLILIVVLIILSNDCGGGGVILGIPGFALVIILSVALGVLVGYLQSEGLRLTQAATIISGVILGGLCSIIAAMLFCVP